MAVVSPQSIPDQIIDHYVPYFDELSYAVLNEIRMLEVIRLGERD